jgi:hypothetical protein
MDFKGEQWFSISPINPEARILLKFDFQFLSLQEARKLNRKSLLGELISIFDSAPSIDTSLPILPTSTWHLRVHVYKAESLQRFDGVPNPVFIARCNGAIARAEDKLKTSNPEWFQTLGLSVDFYENLSLCPDLNCLVYDKTEEGPLKLLGRFRISISDVVLRNVVDNLNLDPKWFELVDDEGNLAGRVLLATQLLEPSKVIEIPDLRNQGHK